MRFIAALVALGVLAGSGPAAAQFPDKPIRLMAPYAPGGNIDVTARIVADKLKDVLGVQVLVENKAGASGMIGSEVVARAAPDGYTLLVSANSLVAVPAIYGNAPYDWKTAFQPISHIQAVPGVLLVHPSSPIKTLKDFVALGQDGKFAVADSGIGTTNHIILTLLALLMGRLRMLSSGRGQQIIRALEAVPAQLESILAQNDRIRQIALKYAQAEDFFFLGRQYNFPVALEGALKLKEISYIHAEGYPAAEMKHGPIALVDEQTPSVFLTPRGSVFDKVMSNLEEVKARGGPVIAIASEGDAKAADYVAARADEVIFVPDVPEYLQPIVTVIPLQLFAYHAALLRGCDVDKPRNLAKSVTVE